jgi:effector-binding domain-containing protein
MSYDVKQSNISPQLVAYAEGTDNPSQIRDLFGKLMNTVSKHMGANGGKPAGPPFTRYMEMDDESVRMWVGIPLRDTIPGGNGIVVDSLPGGNIAMTTHIGSLDHLGAAHEAVLSWIDESEFEQAGPPWEYYWGDPQKEPDPSKWKTEVFFPLK